MDRNLRLVRQHAKPATYGDAALLKLTSGSTGFPKAILTAESHLVADGERIIRTMGIADKRHATGRDSVVALVWIRQPRDAAAAARHGDGIEGFICSEPGARRRSRISGARVRRRAVHVQLPGGEPADRRLAALFAVAHFCRRTARYADGPRISRSVQHQNPLVLWSQRNGRHCRTMRAMR